MKKVIVILAALAISATAANAQSWLNSFLSMATEQVGNVVAGATSSTMSIEGTWQYNGCAVATSSDNVLASLASNASASTIESKLDAALSKVGIKPGLATFVFSNDGSFTLKSGKISLPGTWTKEGTKLTLNFAKVFNFKLVGTIKTTTSGCELLFDSDKFLTFAQKVIDAASKVSNNSYLTAAQSLLANVKGLQLGFKLSK